MVAVSADPQDESAGFIADSGITIPLLSDPRLEAISAYGVAMKGGDIAVPAAFVINQKGTITFSYIGESMADRPDSSKLLQLAAFADKQ